MRILVTGHKGYIGTVLVPMLLSEGHEVVGFDSDLYARCSFMDGMIEVPEILKDVRDAQLADVDGIDAVMHLAGLSNDPLGDLNPRSRTRSITKRPFAWRNSPRKRVSRGSSFRPLAATTEPPGTTSSTRAGRSTR